MMWPRTSLANEQATNDASFTLPNHTWLNEAIYGYPLQGHQGGLDVPDDAESKIGFWRILGL